MKQNTILWLLPELNQPVSVLLSGEKRTISFVQCLDGKFSYDIWILAQGEGETLFRVEVNGTTLYESMRIPERKNGVWYLLGGVTIPKGEHRMEICNVGDMPVSIQGFLMGRSTEYITGGMADQHSAMLMSGKSVEEILDDNFAPGVQETAEEKERRLAQLARMGFLYDESQYAAEGRCRCGVPMGGIGAGKIELDKDGIFTAITINNNQDVPIYRVDGSFFGVRWKEEGTEAKAVLLQKGGHLPDTIPRVDDIQFEGLFPHAHLKYEGLPFKLELDAFSSLVPYDVVKSSLPGVVYRFQVENTTNASMDISLLFSWENILGVGGSAFLESGDMARKTPVIYNTWNPCHTWCNREGNRQKAWTESEKQGLHFQASQAHGNPSSFGEYTLLNVGKPEEVSVCENWDSWQDGKLFWDMFVREGFLKSITMHQDEEIAVSMSQSRNETIEVSMSQPQNEATEESHPTAALCRKMKLEAGEKREVVFVLSWYMPHFLDAKHRDIGVHYSNHFADSRQVANYLAENYDRLQMETCEFEKRICASNLPKWLQHKLINDRFPIYTCSWFAKDGKFAINEAPTGMMGCLGTMDQRLACNSFYLNFFPELDRTEMMLFANQQGDDGSIPHDLGSGLFLDEPHRGSWSDLCSSFILQVYKIFIYTNESSFLEEVYPKIKRAVTYQLSIDYDKDGIPDVGAGNGTTYDTYHWYGACAFVASLWLAELKACIRLAEFQKDTEFANQCMALFEQAQKSMIDKLWKEFSYGGHFINYCDVRGNHESENCFIAQLAGQWFADLMDLGDLLPAEKIREALNTIWNRNVNFKNFTLMSDETTPEGDAYGFGYTFLQYDEVYFGCLAISRGMAEYGLECYRRIWEATKSSPWNIGLTYQTDGFFTGLPYYMTNPASLFMLDVLGGWLPDAVAGRLQIEPTNVEDELELPVFSPKVWAWISWKAGKYCEIRIDRLEEDVAFTEVFWKNARDVCAVEGLEGEFEMKEEGALFRAMRPLRVGDVVRFVFG